MVYSEALGAKQSAEQARAELDGTPEEFEQRQEVINRGDSLVDSLAAYLGTDITPVAATAELADIDFNTSLLFLVDGKYVFHYRTFGTYDGYDMWEISMPVSRNLDKHEARDKVKFSDIVIGYDFTGPKGLSGNKPMQRSGLVDLLIGLHTFPPAADDIIDDKTFLDLTIERFSEVNAHLVGFHQSAVEVRQTYDFRQPPQD